MRIRGFFFTWETRWNRKAFLKAPPHKRSAEDQLIPGGYVEFGETPEETLTREFQEETGITVKAGKLIGVRFSDKDWYSVFTASYVSGEARSDNDENSEAVWIDAYEATERDDVPDLTRIMIQSALKETGFVQTDFVSRNKDRIQKLYTI